MISKNKIKFLKSLVHKKHRDIHQAYIIEGTKLMTEAIASSVQLIDTFVTKEWLEKHGALLRNHPHNIVSANEMQTISLLTTAPGILAVVARPSNQPAAPMLQNKLSLAVDGISDPGNLGSIIRSAEWFGVEQIFCSDDTVDAYNPKVVQASMGSIFRMTITEISLEKLCKAASANGIPVVGAFMEGESIYQTSFNYKQMLLVIGSESHGIREYLHPMIDAKVTIPQQLPNNGGLGAESLNAAIAASIILSTYQMKKSMLQSR